jgi:hypothetical protein
VIGRVLIRHRISGDQPAVRARPPLATEIVQIPKSGDFSYDLIDRKKTGTPGDRACP